MDIVTKIAKLTRIPHLLQRKREVEKNARKKKDESGERPPFPLKEKPAFKKSHPPNLPKSSSKSLPELPKAAKKGIGERIDLTI